MFFIELSDSQNQTKFNLRVDLIESVASTNAGNAQVVLTSGRSVFCYETRPQVMRIIEDAMAKAETRWEIDKRAGSGTIRRIAKP